MIVGASTPTLLAEEVIDRGAFICDKALTPDVVCYEA